MKKIIFALSLFCAASSVLAKLPAASPEAAAAAAVTAAKTAWSGKSASFALCNRQDKLSATYLKSAKGKGKTAVSAGTCTNPGAFVYTKAPLPKSTAVASTATTAAKPATAAVKSAVATPVKKS
jgi:hypothetical protein